MSRLNDEAVQVIRGAAERWPTTFVARREISRFTGGVIAPGTLANLDSKGLGPRGAFRIGRQVCYPTVSLTEWLVGRLEIQQ